MPEADISENQIRDAIAGFADPETGRDVLKTGQIRDIRVEGAQISLVLELTSHSAPLSEATKDKLEQLVRSQVPRAFVDEPAAVLI